MTKKNLISFRLPRWLYDALNTVSAERGITRSRLIVELLTRGLHDLDAA